MARRPRDYAAEYARRVAREQTRAAAEGREPSLARARGHGSRERESLERRLRKAIRERKVRIDREGNIVTRGYQTGKKPSTKGMIDRYGMEHLKQQLDLSNEAAKAYESGNTDRARLLWMQRDQNLPEWLFWYHGIFG